MSTMDTVLRELLSALAADGIRLQRRGSSLRLGPTSKVTSAIRGRVKTMKSGLNVGFVNVTEGYSNVDISGIGISKRSGVQIGFVNLTSKIEGFQIGFLNFAENGILPFFPIFNMPKKRPEPATPSGRK